MVKFYSSNYTYDHDFGVVSLAVFLKYPNPYSSHVKSVDTVSRHIDSEGRLHTTRLLVKKGRLPKWATSFLGRINESYILEDSIVDKDNKVMQSWSRNLDHTKIMRVDEHVKYQGTNQGTTIAHTEVRILSQFSLIRDKIEAFGHKRFPENMLRSRKGMNYIMELITAGGFKLYRQTNSA
ncbi:hypothetical protein CANCADRAFT_30890 [Tortispora caseinolytica NRRL Y-17796]|uniref:PRELI/MSF1 domain-containing protein n=1 Tax=Tortispora caseinolytica NRRL Y-17796 TaxID=767744 RepID=A0A1E4TMI9_9ASCO|nr:hypothetical protein CANCADRAFT_30890 [Tortispora caseinolytica NRRL Y-17796]